MGIRFSVKADVERVLASLNEAQRKIVPEAVSAALNRAAKQSHTAAIRESAGELKVQQKVMRRRLRFQRRDRASKRYWEAGVFSVVSDLKSSELGNIRQLKAGAKAGRYTFGGAFKATMPSSKYTGAYKRLGRERFPIKEMRVPIHDTVTRIVEKNIRGVGMKVFSDRFHHELRYRLKKRGLA